MTQPFPQLPPFPQLSPRSQAEWAQIVNIMQNWAAALAPVANLQNLGNYANDAAAATGGVAVGGVYRNGSVLQIRVT